MSKLNTQQGPSLSMQLAALHRLGHPSYAHLVIGIDPKTQEIQEASACLEDRVCHAVANDYEARGLQVVWYFKPVLSVKIYQAWKRMNKRKEMKE